MNMNYNPNERNNDLPQEYYDYLKAFMAITLILLIAWTISPFIGKHLDQELGIYKQSLMEVNK